MPDNIGGQIVSIIWRAAANSSVVNKRQQGVISTGIYSGGYLTKVPATNSASLSPLVCEIGCEVGDEKYQVRVETTEIVTPIPVVKTTQEFIILRWTYTGAVSDFMEILAVAAGDIRTTDLVVGRCTWDGSDNLLDFVYDVGIKLTNPNNYYRTTPNVQDLFLKVEPTGKTGLLVRVRAGRIQIASAKIDIPDYEISLGTAPIATKKIYLVYVTAAGAIAIDATGAEAAVPVAPTYKGKLVLAEVTLSIGDTVVTAAEIRDVRNFITATIVPDDVYITKATDGKLTLARDFRDYILIRDVKANGVNGGTFTSGAWRTRDLTEETSDAGGHAGLGVNQITLAAGTYECHIKCPAAEGVAEIKAHQARLYNVTDGTVICYGTSEYSEIGGHLTTSSVIVYRFTIALSKVIRIEHRCQTTVNTFGFGRANNFGNSEVYTIAEFWKVA